MQVMSKKSVHMGPHGSIWVHMGPHGSTSIGPSKATRVHTNTNIGTQTLKIYTNSHTGYHIYRKSSA